MQIVRHLRYDSTQSERKISLYDQVSVIVGNQGRQNRKYEILLLAPVDSLIGFKIQLKFSAAHLITKGTLQYQNGRPLIVPEIYEDSFLKRLHAALQKIMRFQFVRQTAGLIFYSGIKLENETSDPLAPIARHLEQLTRSLALIHQQLALLGLCRKTSLKGLRLKSLRLSLLQQIARLWENSNKQTQEQVKLSEGVQETGKGSVFRYFSHLEYLQGRECQDEKNIINHLNNDQNLKVGGYFEVQKRTCSICQHQTTSGIPIRTQLAVKKLKQDQAHLPHCQNKLQKQFRIIQQIQDRKHSLVYWLPKSSISSQQQAGEQQRGAEQPPASETMVMEFIEQSFDDRIYDRRTSAKDVVDYSRQVIEGVSILHKSGVVHRDLKPDNLMIKANKQNPRQNLVKIIDFGQSSLVGDEFSNLPQDLLGSTLPYSPPECYLSCPEGYNKVEIDIWSVGVLIFQILHKRIPISYSRCFAADIYRGWRLPEQFCAFVPVRKFSGARVLEHVFSLLTLHSVCIDQKQRMPLEVMRGVMLLLWDYLAELDSV